MIEQKTATPPPSMGNEQGGIAPIPERRLYTTKEIAIVWGLSTSTIRKLVREKRLRPIVGIDTKWRWRPEDLEEAGVFQRL